MFGLVSWFRRMFGGSDALGARASEMSYAAVDESILDARAGPPIVPPPPASAWMPGPVRDRMKWEGGPDRWGYRRAVGYALGGKLYDEAYALLRLDLAEARGLTPPDEQFRLLEILATTAAIAFREGDIGSAERLARETIAIAEETGAEFDADCAAALVRLGEVVCARGDRVSAKRIYEDALATRVASLGPAHDHCRVLSEYVAGFSTESPVESHEASVIERVEGELSYGHSISRDMPREEAFREAFNMAQCDLGGSHQVTGRACSALAEILDFRGCLQEARKFWFHSCDIAMLHHGPGSVEVEQALAAIAANQQAIKRGDDRGRSDVRAVFDQSGSYPHEVK